MPMVTSKDGTELAVIKNGKGPVVILVGGALQTKSDHLMGKLIPLLARDFTVVSYDRRNRGDSSDTAPYEVEREIEDLDAVIRSTGGPAFVFGNSSGGNLALLAAASLQNITKVAVYEAPFIPERTPGDGREYVAALEKLVAEGKNGKAVKMFLKRIGMPAPMVAAISIMPAWAGMKELAPSLVYDGHVVGDGSVPRQLADITVPVLIATGASEQMKTAGASVATVVAGAERQILEGQSHDVNPEVLAAALVKFFKK